MNELFNFPGDMDQSQLLAVVALSTEMGKCLKKMSTTMSDWQRDIELIPQDDPQPRRIARRNALRRRVLAECTEAIRILKENLQARERLTGPELIARENAERERSPYDLAEILKELRAL